MSEDTPKPELAIPGRNGGMLNAGGTPGNAGGRGNLPSEIRTMIRQKITPSLINKMEGIAQGKASIKYVNVSGKSVKMRISPNHQEQVRAAEWMAKVALNKEYQIGITDKELAIAVLKVAFEFIAPEKQKDFKDRLRAVAGHLVDG